MLKAAKYERLTCTCKPVKKDTYMYVGYVTLWRRRLGAGRLGDSLIKIDRPILQMEAGSFSKDRSVTELEDSCFPK